MYSEDDINSAVAAGAISADAARSLRDHVAKVRQLPSTDEENFRLVNSFNDIFVTIACLLVFVAALMVGGAMLGGIGIAVAAWFLAEVFTLRRRAALPSIVLLIAFVGGAAISVCDILSDLLPRHTEMQQYEFEGETRFTPELVRYPWEQAAIIMGSAFAGALAAIAHWMRFRVAITVAAGVLCLVLVCLSVVAGSTNTEVGSNALIAPAAFVSGLAVFAYAMRWDMEDPLRTSQRADIAFWLHLVAAPLIAHPLFYWMGVTEGRELALTSALGVIAIYLLFGIVALVVDRRALLVSALVYVLIALAKLVSEFGGVAFDVGVPALLIGVTLLTMSIYWTGMRASLVRALPQNVSRRLPPIQVGRV